jgi:hypothetical protein
VVGRALSLHRAPHDKPMIYIADFLALISTHSKIILAGHLLFPQPLLLMDNFLFIDFNILDRKSPVDSQHAAVWHCPCKRP